MINNVNHVVHDNNPNWAWMFNERGRWTAAVYIDVSVIIAPNQGFQMFDLEHCVATALDLPNAVFLILFSRAILC